MGMLGRASHSSQRLCIMIIGIGIDRTDMREAENNITRYVSRLSADEFSVCQFKPSFVACVAKKHAAKEAVMKALGSNDALGNVNFTDIEISNSKSGRPLVTLKRTALTQLNSITPKGHTASVLISITDDVPVAEAICIIDATPAPDQSA
jgi:holo-[acyl-carrier protein] synthase